MDQTDTPTSNQVPVILEPGTRQWDRFGAAAGFAYVVFIVVGNSLTEDVAAGPGALYRLGIAFELFGFACFSIFVAHVFNVLRRVDRSWMPELALIGGVATLAVKIGSGAPLLVANVLRPGDLSAEMTHTLTDLNGVAFNLTFFTFGLFQAAMAGALLRNGLLSRWVGWSGLVLGVSGIVAVNAPMDSEVAALPLVLSLIWLIVVSVGLVRMAGSAAETALPAAGK